METQIKEEQNFPLKAEIDLDSSCRICLIADSELILIFDPANGFNGITIATMINECSPFKAIRFDDFPQQICLKCVENVKVAFAFRKHCEESHSIVSAYLNGGIKPSITDARLIPKLEKCTQTDENSFHPCEKCDLKFFTFEALRLHRLHSHRGTKNECRICKKTFRRLGYLKGHYTMYHPELGFNENNNCDICGKAFERRTTLRRHMENVHKISQKPQPINPNMPFNFNGSAIIKDDSDENHVKEKYNSDSKFKRKSEDVKGLTKNKQSKRKKSFQSRKLSHFSKDKKIVRKKKVEIENESSEDEVPISKLKEEKLTTMKTEETDNMMSDIDIDFENYNDVADQQTDNEDDLFDEKKSTIKYIDEILISEHSELKKPIEKDIKVFENPDGLSEHTLNENQLNPGRSLNQQTCTICLKVFRFPHHLKRHMLALHSKEKPFKCSTCTSAFATPDYLKSHMKKCSVDRVVSRARSKKYDCKGCEEKFSSIRALNHHTRQKHPNLFKKVFTCSYCASSFETRHECTVHTNTVHENDKEYLCTECGQRFVRNRALEIHMRRHRGEKNHKCKFCGKGFVRAGDKDLHEKYHTGDKRFKCEVCGQGFVRNYSLRVHMRIHTGEKPYHCESCPRTFAQSNDLKTHVRRDHTGERYVCEIDNCGESFLQLFLLNKHKRNVHNVNAPSHIQRVKKVYDIQTNEENNIITGN